MTDLNLSMFRAYDIRTPAHRLTPALAGRLARAEAVYFREVLGAPGVLVAHDARSTGPAYLQLAAEEYARAGLEVIVLPGVSSTSLLYFAAMQRPDLAAVMHGASHNPAGDTGQKLLGPGVRPLARHIGPEGGLDRIEELYARGAEPPAAPRRGRIRAHEALEAYVAYSMERAGVARGGLSGLRLLHDYLNGAAGREMMVAFDRAGADLTPVHFAADGRFPLGDPNPVKQAVVAEGLAALNAGKYRLATFFDGDGDRVDFYRGDGTYVSSSFVYAAVLPRVLAHFRQPGPGVFADLKSNPLAVMEMARAGATVDVIRNGHSQIKSAMYEDIRRIGTVEESAHFYEAFDLDGRRFCTENTLYVALLVARTWMEEPERFDRLIALEGGTSREREWGYKFAGDSAREEALRAVRAHFEAQGARALTHMPNGYDLEATLIRRGLPFDVDADTRLAPDWLQVCQRVSQSEDGLARWEVVAATPGIAAGARRDIAEIVRPYGAGAEYQG
ncbi:MAG: phosphoglucomutase [Chthonomonadales bacterium]|nr:phosphoglucomutase [Chthonomonadales bacterium]